MWLKSPRLSRSMQRKQASILVISCNTTYFCQQGVKNYWMGGRKSWSHVVFANLKPCWSWSVLIPCILPHHKWGTHLYIIYSRSLKRIFAYSKLRKLLVASHSQSSTHLKGQSRILVRYFLRKLSFPGWDLPAGIYRCWKLFTYFDVLYRSFNILIQISTSAPYLWAWCAQVSLGFIRECFKI